MMNKEFFRLWKNALIVKNDRIQLAVVLMITTGPFLLTSDCNNVQIVKYVLSLTTRYNETCLYNCLVIHISLMLQSS